MCVNIRHAYSMVGIVLCIKKDLMTRPTHICVKRPLQKRLNNDLNGKW